MLTLQHSWSHLDVILHVKKGPKLVQTSSRRKRCFNFTPELTQRLVKNAYLIVIACVSVGSAAVRRLQAAAHRLDCQGEKMVCRT